MSRLKTLWIVLVNVVLMAAILGFVALYSNRERKENYDHQVEHFVNTAIAMDLKNEKSWTIVIPSSRWITVRP